MPPSIRFFSVAPLGLIAFILCLTQVHSGEPPRYSAKVVFFAKAVALHFPDFDMTYSGERRVIPPQYPRGWWAYDFVVRSKSGEQKLSWSAGTGDIGPVRFKVDGSEFQLELSHSDKLGALREDELVISKVAL
jgi:hypothetical protein